MRLGSRPTSSSSSSALRVPPRLVSCFICALMSIDGFKLESASIVQRGRVAFFDGLVIALEGLFAVVFLATTFSSASETVVLSGRELVLGSNLGLFWAGFVLLGLVVPLALDYQLYSRQPIRPSLGVTSAACVLAGGFMMRYCLIQAGVHPGI